MADEAPAAPPSLGLRARHWLRTHRFLLSCIVLGAAILMVVLALGDFTPLANVYPFTAINGYTDQSGSGGENWNLVFAIAGPILVIIGGYARSRFEQLMRSKSKAELLRNIPEIEDLLWDLTPYDQVRFERKCIELHIRR